MVIFDLRPRPLPHANVHDLRCDLIQFNDIKLYGNADSKIWKMASRPNPVPGSSAYMHGYQMPSRYMQGHQGMMVRGNTKLGAGKRSPFLCLRVKLANL